MDALIAQAMEAHRRASRDTVQALLDAAHRAHAAAETARRCIEGSRRLLQHVDALHTTQCRVPALMPSARTR